MGEPSSTRRNQKQSSYSSNTELVHKKHKSISIVSHSTQHQNLSWPAVVIHYGASYKQKKNHKRKGKEQIQKKKLGENIKIIY
ncbi:hypothetical protein NC653_009654 [Populus alba x Populus x berolinensis]|uniref:Uncharacterized protein n=1 Tax=Populus alba x Populus x berolinensis TaxID=444605 RepID=A0AAD6WAL9_9ROSI|nr:hypothetical protein NC653_009654 [Populus alba x Populus x berolinensis]